MSFGSASGPESVAAGAAEIPERGHRSARLLVDRRRRLQHPVVAPHLLAQFAERAALLVAQVPPLARVGHEVVELGVRAVDEVPPPVGERMQIAPTEVESRIEGLGVDPPRRLPAELEQRSAGHRRRQIGADHPEHRGRDVEQARRLFDPRSGPRAVRAA